MLLLLKKNNSCPCCKNKLVKNGFKKVNIKMLKSSQFNTILRVSKQRYLCKNCKKSFSINLKFVEPNCSISNDVKLAIKLELKECRALKYIANKKYFKYIENSLSSIYLNGRIEGVIRRIKVFKNIAYGYRSFFNFKKKILISANI